MATPSAAVGGACRRDPGFAAQLALDLDPADVRVVLEVFHQNVGRLVVVLQDDAAAGDVQMFRRTCHAIAGAAGAVGAAALEDACRRAMTQDDLLKDRLPAMAAEIQALGAAVMDETAAYLARGQ